MPWGSYWAGAWAGAPALGAFYLLGAAPSGARSLRVTFSQQPLWRSSIGRYDSANLERWELERVDTGRAVPLLGTRYVSAFVVELLMAETFAVSPLITYRITANQIHSESGNALVAPDSLEFAGMPTLREDFERARPLVDLFNPQTSGTRLNGALQVGTDGDYTLESGAALLKKLVVRRILTGLDEYFHLSGQGYGAGLSAKRLMRTGDLIILKTQLEAQIALEPEVVQATVALELKRSGELDVRCSLTPRSTGQQITLQLALNPNGGSQVG